LLSAVGYLKDNILLPSGFNKQNAEKDIAVIGEAADDPNFTDRGSIVRYSVSTGGAAGPSIYSPNSGINRSDSAGLTTLLRIPQRSRSAS
jgi:hypothetical protein